MICRHLCNGYCGGLIARYKIKFFSSQNLSSVFLITLREEVVTPGLFKKQIKPGKFTIPNRGLSDELSIDLPNSIHLKSVLSGLLAAIFSKNMVFGVLPIILGIWSIKVIVI